MSCVDKTNTPDTLAMWNRPMEKANMVIRILVAWVDENCIENL